ncbi:MAG: hypothetical protein ACJ75B_09535 [Flavisolibacter sp.]
MNRIISCMLIVTGNMFCQTALSQTADSSFKPSGKLWGLAFGDYYYKAHSDSQNRGGSNQYSGIEQGRNAFQIRRIYLGYQYELHPKFSAEVLLAAEDNQVLSSGSTSGDLLIDNKLSIYIKLANLRWKNIWKGTDLIIGQSNTPTYNYSSDPVWSYRPIERTMLDIRRNPSTDLGLALQGKFDPASGNLGYHIMVGNGTGSRPENDRFKRFYGDVYAKFLNKKLIVDLYSDYERLNWKEGFHHSKSIFKIFVGYSSPQLSVGIEAFSQNNQSDYTVFPPSILGTPPTDTLSGRSRGISLFVHGMLVKNRLRFFARADQFNPYTDHGKGGTIYHALQSNLDPNNKELFITTGLDFIVVPNVHLMPNIWYERYTNQNESLSGSSFRDHDLVYRVTFYFVFGK